ncbi:diguanylate cyclase [Photobacterium sagamiensis]|uniref:diguanylate cyclase n=1 Tax=Photobacterium sagamiensis TaxID=2910241 RepID=UPI003D141272
MGATVLAEKLRAAIESSLYAISEDVTSSIGIAECRKNESWNHLIKRADDALYKAKSQGRNCVVTD